MNNEQVVYVNNSETTVCCRGVGEALGHPAIYLTFDQQSSVTCYYCGKEFIRQGATTKNSVVR